MTSETQRKDASFYDSCRAAGAASELGVMLVASGPAKAPTRISAIVALKIDRPGQTRVHGI
jgi:hypothetical protein